MRALASAPLRYSLRRRSMRFSSQRMRSGLSRRRRAPNQKALFDQRDEPVDAEHEYGKNDHTGKHARRVERSLGLIDEIAKSRGRAQILAHHGADDGKS